MASDILEYLQGPNPRGLKWKRLNQFLKEDTPPQGLESLEAFLLPFKGSYFEPFISTKLAEKHRCSDLVIKLLKSPNWSVVKAAAHSQWMFEGDGKFANPAFVISLFHEISYQCRQLMIHRIKKYVTDPKKIDEFFQLISTKYGFLEAQTLLIKTTEEQFHGITKARPCSFSDKKLCAVFERDPQFVLYEMRNNARPYVSYKRTYKLLASTMPQDFLQLIIDKSPHFGGRGSLGRRLVKRLLVSHQELICKHAIKFQKLLGSYRKIVRRVLGWEKYKLFLRNMFPSTDAFFLTNEQVAYSEVTSGESHITFWLQDEPRQWRYEALCEICLAIIGSTIGDCWERVTHEMLLAIPGEYRDAIIDKKLEQDGVHETSWTTIKLNEGPEGLFTWYGKASTLWQGMRGAERAQKKLKTLLFNTHNLQDRARILKMILLSCIASEDETALVSAMDFAIKRCRNDAEQVRQAVGEALEFLFRNVSYVKLTSLELWNRIMEFDDVQQLYGESHIGRDELLLFGLTTMFKHKLEIDPVLKRYSRPKSREDEHYFFDSLYATLLADRYREMMLRRFKFSREERHLIVSKLVPVLWQNRKSSDSSEGAVYAFLRFVMDWNRKYKQWRIRLDDYPVVIELLKKTGTDSAWFNKPVCSSTYLLNLTKTRIYNDNTASECVTRLFGLISRLKTEPENLKEDFDWLGPLLDTFISCVPEYVRVAQFPTWEPRLATIFRQVWKEQNYKFNKGLAKKCLELLSEVKTGETNVDEDAQEDGDENMRKISYLIILSQIQDPKDYAETVKQLLPKPSEVLTKTRTLFQKMKAVGWTLKMLPNSMDSLNLVEELCKGDLLQCGLNSYLKQAERHPVPQITPYLATKYLDGPVSFRKHNMRLTFRISTTAGRLKMARGLMESKAEGSQNATIRLEILKIVCECHVSQPSSESWEAFKEYFGRLKQEEFGPWMDVIRSAFLKLPVDDLQAFVEFWMGCIEQLPARPNEVFESFLRFTSEALSSKRIQDLSFAKKIVQQCGEKMLENKNPDFVSFLVNYVLLDFEKDEDAAVQRLEETVSTLLQFVDEDFAKRFQGMKHLLANLLQEFRTKAKEIGYSAVSNLATVLKTVVVGNAKESWYLEVVFRIDFTLAILESQAGQEQELRLSHPAGDKVGQLCEAVVTSHGGEILGLITALVRSIIASGYKDSESDMLNFVKGLVGQRNSRIRLIVATPLVGNLGSSTNSEVVKFVGSMYGNAVLQNDTSLNYYMGALAAPTE